MDPTLEFPLSRLSVPEFLDKLDERLKPIVSPKKCQLELNQLLKDSHSFQCPRILEYAVEQIVRDSLERNSHLVKVDRAVTSKDQIQIIITDDGKSFSDVADAPKFLMGFYLADVLIRQIGGTLTIKHILPGEGLQTTLSFSANPIKL